MSSVLGAVKSASIKEIEIDEIKYRVRRVSSADLARVGFAWLSMASPEDDSSGSPDIQKMLQRASESKLVELAKLKDAIIAAGLIAIGHKDFWDECRVTLKQSEEDIENGVLWVGSLPAGEADNKIFETIINLSTEGGKVAERLSSFPESTGNARATRRRSKKVQPSTT
jgi:hypothetical protein|tara:strand:- start:6483 stop:6989 length:507 start_codon:yes stop_codon:yes gene_type:complete